jgi:hypothetical protein
LSERSEFPRDPFDALTHRVKRDTGRFFWLLFLPLRKVTFSKAYRIGQLSEPHHRWKIKIKMNRK